MYDTKVSIVTKNPYVYAVCVSIGFYAIEVIVFVVILVFFVTLFNIHSKYDSFSSISFGTVRKSLFVAKQNKTNGTRKRKSGYTKEEKKKKSIRPDR